MAFGFCSFASGSSGNCYMVRTDDTVLLVDVGIDGKNIIGGLSAKGADISDVNGILVTHEHNDHIRSIRMMGRKAVNAKIYGTQGTLECVRDVLPPGRVEPIARHQRFELGDIIVTSFSLSHDAVDPVGYSFEHGGKKIVIVTDTGIVTKEIFDEIRTADALVLEANHEVNILRMGPYPYPLKQRILGVFGHLSNETAGSTLCSMLRSFKGDDMPQVLLGHLSKENNSPEMAMITVKNILEESNNFINRDLSLSVAHRSMATDMIIL